MIVRMRGAALGCAAWGLALLSGCARDPYVTAYVESLNVEKRALEDLIYDLEDEYNELEAKYEALLAERQAPASHSAPSQRSRSDSRRQNIEDLFQVEPQAPSVDDGRKDSPTAPAPAPAPEDSSPPVVEPSTTTPSRPAPATPLPREVLPDLSNPAAPNPATTRPAAPLFPPLDKSSQRSPTSPALSHVTLDLLSTGAFDDDGRPGDDGITIGLEPRSADDFFVPQAGRVTVLLVDPAKSGPASRLVRWDLSAEHVAAQLDKRPTGKGFHLRLEWPDEPPATSRARILVRYVAPDGRTIDAQRDLTLRLPDQYSHRWTPRSFARTKDAEPPRVGMAAPATKLAEPSSDSPQEHSVLKRRPVERASFEAEAESAPATDSSAPRARPSWKPNR